MSKHNYSQYSKNTVNVDETVVEETPVAVEETPTVVEETPVVDVAPAAEPVAEVETSKKKTKPAKPANATGIVSGCTKLNVRAMPNATAAVLCVVDAKTELKIDESKTNKDWCAVCTSAGIEGYCMRKFVEVKA